MPLASSYSKTKLLGVNTVMSLLGFTIPYQLAHVTFLELITFFVIGLDIWLKYLVDISKRSNCDLK